MEQTVLRIGFAVLLVMLTVAFLLTRGKPEARRRFMDTLPIHGAFVVMLLGGAFDLPLAVRRATYVVVAALILLAFGMIWRGLKRLE
jgi:RsiW-degrading membrane proteinase PrsW (M82 family)